MPYEIFRTNPNEGITVARKIVPIRGPKPETYQYEYGASDKNIFEKGFLLFNYHPDQWGGGHDYSSFGAPGTRVSGLPITLMDNREQAMKTISKGELSKASSMRSTAKGRNDGAILLVSFTPEQVSRMGGVGINVPFDRKEGQPSALLVPVIEGGSLLLRIRDLNELAKLDPGLRSRFNSDRYLLGSTGEFFIPQMLSIKEYRDQILVFRPDKESDGFHSYLLKDTKEGREGEISRL